MAIKKSNTVDTEFLPGDIGLEKSKGFLPTAIRWFMNQYKKMRKMPQASETYNHAFVIINVWDNLFVVEALAKGVVISPFELTYKNKTNVKYKTPIKPYSEAEKEKISKLATTLVFETRRYDFLSLLLWQPLLVVTGKWFGSKNNKATKRFYCSELAATLANLVRANTFAKPYTVNPADLDVNKYYRDKVISN